MFSHSFIAKLDYRPEQRILCADFNYPPAQSNPPPMAQTTSDVEPDNIIEDEGGEACTEEKEVAQGH